MDWTNNDTDHPAGSSPWGSSPVASPQHTQSAFTPSSPSPYAVGRMNPNYGGDSDTVGSYTQGENSATGSGSGNGHEVQRPGTADSAQGGRAVSGFEGASEPSQQEQTYGGQRQGQQQHQQSQQGYPHQSQRTEPQRYHSGSRQASHPQPQSQRPYYKLQAKITSLERTGRKDPILRFDVHVSQLMSPHDLQSWNWVVDAYRPISPNSAPHNSATCAARTASSSSWPSTSSPRIPRPLCPLFRRL